MGVIVAGAGHNGLACAIYLSPAGKRVLMLAGRTRVGETPSHQFCH
jgi:phytoene dehydrogenase-like protein